MLLTTKHLKKICVICFFIPIINIPCFAQDYLPFKGIIQVETNISDGVYSPLEAINLARKEGIKIVIFTDTFLRRWEYGIWPLQNLIKIKKEQPSIVQYGIKKYLKKIDELNRQFPDMVILSGVEAAPFYWWQGNPFAGKIFNFSWAKHLLVLGLNARDYEYLPVVSKRYLLPQSFKDLVLVALFISVIFISGLRLRLRRGRITLFGYMIILLAIIFLINNFPFPSKYDAYHDDQGYKPYQGFIDYVQKRGGFVSWAHPGFRYSRSLGRRVDIISLPYFDVLTNTFDYNAFAGLYGGDVSACLANREWDTVLKEFCLNKRKGPVFITAEVDYDGSIPRQKIYGVQTIFLLSKLDRDAVFEALRKGRFYARIYEDNFYIDLDEFSIEKKLMGETAQIENKPKLIIKGNAFIYPEAEVKLEIIRGGEIAQIYEIKQGRFDLEFIDNTLGEAAKRNYYRLNFFSGEKLILVSNPIFCEVR